VRLICFRDWKNQVLNARFKSFENAQLASEARRNEALSAVKELETEIVLLKSKRAEASANSALALSSRSEHLQQLHASRAAELSAICRAEQAEDTLAAAQLENELLKEQVRSQLEEIARLREQLQVGIAEKSELSADVQSLSAALKQQVTLMMKRAAAVPPRR
jgi:pantothenate synthetase